MLEGKISKLVIVIASKDDGEDLERWEFGVEVFARDKDKKEVVDENGEVKKKEKEKPKSEKEIQDEIQSLFRQITASVTFLPMLDGRCTFNVLVYTHGNAEVPVEWGDSEAREITNGEKVALRSWQTNSHRVETAVSYRLVD